MELLISAVAGFITTHLLEALKDQRWFPFMNWAGTRQVRNVITPIITAVVVASGITFTWDEVNGALTITGLVPNDVVRSLVSAVVLWATQEMTYRKLVQS